MVANMAQVYKRQVSSPVTSSTSAATSCSHLKSSSQNLSHHQERRSQNEQAVLDVVLLEAQVSEAEARREDGVHQEAEVRREVADLAHVVAAGVMQTSRREAEAHHEGEEVSAREVRASILRWCHGIWRWRLWRLGVAATCYRRFAVLR